jgi:hypothetical protein
MREVCLWTRHSAAGVLIVVTLVALELE